MTKYNTYFGIDSHARTTTICAIIPETGETQTRTFRGNDYGEMNAWMETFPCPGYGVYESGCTGYVPSRLLSTDEIEVVPIASSKMPTSADARSKKNDRKDAMRLAKYIIAHELKPVWVPPSDIEGLRDLSQAIHDLSEQRKAARNRIEGFLCRHGFIWNERTKTHTLKKRWGSDFRAWLAGIDLDDIASQAAYESALAQEKVLNESYEKLLSRALEIATQSRMYPVIEALMCLKGIGFITALAFTAEVGDFTRFSSGRKVASYFGFNPSERSSADSHHLGSITKQGSTLVRMLLTECAWTFVRTNPYCFKKCPDGVDISIYNHACECSKRLSKRRKYLLDKGLSSCKANTATASEMTKMLLFIGKDAQLAG